MRAIRIILSLVLGLYAMLSHGAGMHSVTLSWEPNPATQSSGFIVYYGMASGSYAWTTNVGNTTTASIGVLLTGATYYFAVVSFDRDGNESDFSNEISWTPYEAFAPVVSVTGGGRDRMAKVTWTTKLGIATNEVSWCVGGSTNWTTQEVSGAATNHSVSLQAYQAGTVLQFRVTAIDTNGVRGVSEPVTFMVPAVKPGPTLRITGTLQSACNVLGPWDDIFPFGEFICEADTERYFRVVLTQELLP